MKETIPRDDLERRLKDFEEELETLGTRFERGVEDIESEAKHKYRSTFGVLGPLLSSLFGLVVLGVLIWGLYHLAGVTDVNIFQAIADFLSNNIAIFFGLMLLFNYWSYLSSGRGKSFGFLSPLMTALSVIVAIWILANIVLLANIELGFGILDRISGKALNNFRSIILIIVLLSLLFMLFRDGYKNKKFNGKHRVDRGMRRLYRSGRDKLLGGVCGGFGEYFDVDPVLVRIIWVILAFASFGSAILIYIILWILIPRNPGEQWD